jgi:hypothetical protein
MKPHVNVHDSIVINIIYEDNAACIAQMQSGYVKSNVTKHITPKLFYLHELQVNGEISILQTESCDNLANLSTNSLPYSTFSKCVADIGMSRLRDLLDLGRALCNTPCYSYPNYYH